MGVTWSIEDPASFPMRVLHAGIIVGHTPPGKSGRASSSYGRHGVAAQKGRYEKWIPA